MSELDDLLEGDGKDVKLVIGHVIETADDLPPTIPRRTDGVVHPLVSIEELKKPSPQPFKGRPDIDYADLDSLEPLYFPKFLLRRWGEAKFLRSGYYATWRTEAGRRERLGDSDFRKRDVPGKKK